MNDRLKPTKPFLVVRGDAAPGPDLHGAVVAMAILNGAHRGPRGVMGAALARAERLRRPAAAFTSEPHPRLVLRPHEPLFRLTDERAKLRLLAGTGLAGAIVMRF